MSRKRGDKKPSAAKEIAKTAEIENKVVKRQKKQPKEKETVPLRFSKSDKTLHMNDHTCKMTSKEEKPAPIIFGDESLSDCTLVVGSQDFRVHKMVLASRSEFFKAMFYGDFKECVADRFEIKYVSADNFRRFLEIIYTSRISDPEFLRFPTKKDRHTHVAIKVKENDTDKNTKKIQYIESFGKYFHEFWKNTTELTNIANRFNFSSVAKKYLKTVIDKKFGCQNRDCHVCFNYEALGVIHDVGNCSRNGWYNPSVYFEWMKYAPQLPFSSSISIERLGCIQQTVNFSG